VRVDVTLCKAVLVPVDVLEEVCEGAAERVLTDVFVLVLDDKGLFVGIAPAPAKTLS
jgi:hypothetical protein